MHPCTQYHNTVLCFDGLSVAARGNKTDTDTVRTLYIPVCNPFLPLIPGHWYF